MRVNPLLVFGACTLSAVSAGAQVLDQPDRESSNGVYGRREPTPPNVAHSELVVDGSALASYGDDLLSRGEATFDPSVQDSVYGSVLGAGLRFTRASQARSLSVRGSGFFDTGSQRDVTGGGGAEFEGSNSFGRHNHANVSAHLSYVPYLGVSAVRTLPTDGDVSNPELNPTYGSLASGSWNSGGSVGFEHEWSIKDRTQSGYAYDRHVQPEQGYDTSLASMWVQHVRRFGRSLDLSGAYRYGDSDVFETGTATAARQHVVDGLVTYRRRVSRTRNLSLGGGAGANRLSGLSAVTNGPFARWLPTATMQADLDVARSWTIRGDYRRGVTFLPGVSLETFNSDSAAMTLSGLLRPRLDFAVTGDYSRGVAAEGTEQNPAHHETLTLTAQLRYAMSRSTAFIASYSRYQHELQDQQTVESAFPPDFNRSSFRVGMTIWLPVYSGRQTGPRGAAGRTQQ
jgi:hypothetical protein